MSYFWGVVALLGGGAFIGMVAFAAKAGANAQRATQNGQVVAQASALVRVTSAMAKAQATGPQTTEQLLARLDAGEG